MCDSEGGFVNPMYLRPLLRSPITVSESKIQPTFLLPLGKDGFLKLLVATEAQLIYLPVDCS